MIKIVLMGFIVLSIFGCSQRAFDEPRLIKAQGEYLSIKENPTIVKEAPMELIKAAKLYDLSNELKKADDLEHVTYLLENQVKIAKDWAKTKLMQKEIENLRVGKTRAIIAKKDTQIQTLQKEIDEVKEEKIQPLEAPQQESKTVTSIEELQAKERDDGYEIYFYTEDKKPSLVNDSSILLDRVAKFLVENPDRFIVIQGYADKGEGSKTFNLDLSLRRAIEVQELLVDRGVSIKRIFIKGYGDEYPVGTAQENRHVALIILKDGVDPTSVMRDR